MTFVLGVQTDGLGYTFRHPLSQTFCRHVHGPTIERLAASLLGIIR